MSRLATAWTRAWAPAFLLLVAASGDAQTQPASAESYFTNVELVNQHGQTMRLYRDLLHDKIVVIDTIFTECTGICPVLSLTLKRIQEHAGDRMGRDVHLISISVDPETDTPAKLEKMAETYDAGPGWYFLTGDKENVDLALRKLGGYVDNREAHNAILILGNTRTGLWKKALGLAASSKILPIFDSVLNDPEPRGDAYQDGR